MVENNATGATANGANSAWGTPANAPRAETTGEVTDGVNGTPRIDSETRMYNTSTKWVVWY